MWSTLTSSLSPSRQLSKLLASQLFSLELIPEAATVACHSSAVRSKKALSSMLSPAARALKIEEAKEAESVSLAEL